MNFRRKFSAAPFILLLLLFGCTKPEEQNEFSPGLNSADQQERRMVRQSGPEDPYAIHNILKAYSRLKVAESAIPSFDIKPNHVYLRFLPENDGEASLLQSDTTLILFDYPLNHETSGEAVSIEAISGSPYTCLYCVVPAGKTLPPVNHEIIYEVFIPPDRDYSAKSSTEDLTGFYEALVDESMRLTGNLNDEDYYLTTRSSQRKWTPKGTIRVWDDLLGQFIPLQHVNVHARWFTRIETALTDEEGYFQTKSFRHKVHYSIKWENSLFTIRNGLFLQAWFNGPNQKGDWNLDIKGGKSEMFASIHRAAYKSFYGENLDLYRPGLSFGGRTKICYMDENGTGVFLGDWSAGGLLPDIKIWGNEGNRSTHNIFATVTHELGHLSHSQYVGNMKYIRTEKIIRESWAEAVEWALTNDEYNKLGKKYRNYKGASYNHQTEKHNKWPFVSDISYSPIFIDLVDVINQRLANGPAHPNDLISEYSLSFINRYMLMNSVDISSLKAEVTKHKLEGVGDYQIDELFHLY